MSKATNTVGYQPNWDYIAQLVEQGYVREVQHPEDPNLYLYNYTPQAQYEQCWTRDLLLCRGLIARDTGGHREVIARPFPKFFNWQELADEERDHNSMLTKKPALHIRDSYDHTRGPWQVYEKMDGSLGIMYEFAPGDYRIATRGSFTSEQALWATEYLKAVMKDLPLQGLTYLFEIIYPENRIVVDYGQNRGLVLLEVLSTVTGQQQIDGTFEDAFIRVKYHGIKHDIPTDQRENKEGYVLTNAEGFRVKVKHDEYVRLHKILTNTSSRTVWEYLSDPEKDFNELLDNVPDEFYDWVKQVKNDIEADYLHLETCIEQQMEPVSKDWDRREQANYIKYNVDNSAIGFLMLDGKDYSGLIWKLIKPERTLPFNSEQESNAPSGANTGDTDE